MALPLDMLTALTIAGILAILSIYVIVVYKKGWLRRESKTDQAYYLCPNQKCRRVFKKPVWLTDLSKTPAESYQACPHCGVSIKTSLSTNLAAKPILDADQPEPAFQGAVQTRAEKPRMMKSEPPVAKLESSRESSRQSLQMNTSKTSDKPEGWHMPKPIFQFPQIRKDTSKEQSEPAKRKEDKSSFESSRKCSHFFGYVKTLPKNTPIPDECLWCPSIVDCLSHEKKVEAEA